MDADQKLLSKMISQFEQFNKLASDGYSVQRQLLERLTDLDIRLEKAETKLKEQALRISHIEANDEERKGSFDDNPVDELIKKHKEETLTSVEGEENASQD